MIKFIVYFALLCGVVENSCASPGDPTIRVLTGYTDETLAAVPSHNVNSLVNLQIIDLNQALADSAIHVNVVNAGVKSIPNLPSDYSSAFLAIRNNYSLQRARDDLNADVIMILANSGAISKAKVIAAQYSDDAVALIGLAALGDFAYLHEFGHLLGARHQSSGGNLPAYNDTQGIGHGWYERVKLITTNSCAHTIMSYDPMPGLWGVNCTSVRVRRFSTPLTCDNFIGFYSPNGTPLGCLPWGDATHNNAAVINSNAATVAGFHLSKTSSAIAASLITIILNTVGLQ
jgi:Metallo-peptidase family M12B Reprolysin-like